MYRIVFNNRGAVVESWILKGYDDIQENPLELVNEKAFNTAGKPFSVEFTGENPGDVNQALFVAKPADDGLSISFEWTSGGVSATKAFRFEKSSYVVEVNSEIRRNGGRIPHLLAWRGGFGDETIPSYVSGLQTVYSPRNSSSIEVKSAGDVDDAPVTDRGAFDFAGIQDQYFALLALDPKNAELELKSVADNVTTRINPEPELHAGIAVGSPAGNDLRFFIGPKKLDVLEKVNPELASIVDFGWFWFIARPLFEALQWMVSNWIPTWGWSIVILTIAINFVLLPLKLTSLRSMKKMQALQPQIAAINEKYKGVSLRDPKKQQQNQEMMALYQKHGVNPLGGCLPMVLQIPFFFAFYKVLNVAIELRGADWLWVTDLSQPEQIPIRVLPLTMMASQFFMQKMTPSPSTDPAQQKVMMLMPFMFGIMFYSISSGLVLYWLTSNLVGIAQQLLINKFSPPVQVAQPETKAAGKRRK